jgi:hypothetical protein
VAKDPAILKVKPDPKAPSRNIPDTVDHAIVKASLNMATTGAGTFF